MNARTELIKIAAELLQGQNMPSDLLDDYPQESYSANRVACMMEPVRNKHRDWAVRIRRVIDIFDEEPLMG